MDMSDTAYGLRPVCPTCGAGPEAARPAFASTPPAESLPLERHGKFLSGYDSQRIFFSYVRCGTCGTHWTPVYYTQAQLDALYGRQAENMAEVPLAARLATQAAYADLALSVPTPPGDYLELGADIGLFAEACAARSQFGRYILYEPNLDVHAEAKRRLSGHTVELRTDLFAAAHHRPNSVALAAAIHVLDHLLDPRAMLRDLKAVLAPGGLLLVVVHDATSPLARLLGKRFPPFTLQHPQLFDRQSLPALMRAEGLEPVRVRRTRNVFPLGHLAAAALQILGLPADWVPFRRAPLIGLPLGNIGVVARKPL